MHAELIYYYLIQNPMSLLGKQLFACKYLLGGPHFTSKPRNSSLERRFIRKSISVNGIGSYVRNRVHQTFRQQLPWRALCTSASSSPGPSSAHQDTEDGEAQLTQSQKALEDFLVCCKLAELSACTCDPNGDHLCLGWEFKLIHINGIS